MISVVGVPAVHLDASLREGWPSIWSIVTPFLLAVPQEEFTLEEMRVVLENRHAQLWVVLNQERLLGAFVTEIRVYPRTKIAKIMWASGTDIESWFVEASTLVSQWATVQGCSMLEIEGRPGWERFLRKHFPPGNLTKQSIVLRSAL